MTSRLKLVALAATPALLVAAIPAAAYAAQPHATRAAVSGDVVPGLSSHATKTGAVAAGKRLSIAVSLAPKAGLAAFVAQVSDPHSASYGHYLTKAQFQARFGRSKAEVKQVTDYLKAQGLTVGTVHSGNLLIDASGTAAQLEKAFGTQLATYQDTASGRSFYANTTAPTLPSSIASIVSDISGLNSHTVLRHTATPAKSNPHIGPGGGYTPAQIKGGYNVPSGYTGAGQTVAVIEFDGYQPSNISTYVSHYGLGSPAPTTVLVDGGSGPLGDGQVEVELDIEMINAVAPKANVKVYEAPNSDAGEADMYQAIVDAGIKTVSSSWGAAETQRTRSNIDAVDAVMEEGAAEGVGVYSASGDYGSDDAGDGGQSVDFPTSDPYVTGVGGTRLTVTSGNKWSKETAWSGSGGGISADFARPAYQDGVAQAQADGARQVPDVAALADPTPGVSVYTQGVWTVVGGTSAAAPEWAAYAADYDQQAAAAGRPGLGFANPALYEAGGAGFHDITSGSNGAFSAGAGWDFTTGLGSYNATSLTSELLGE